MLRGSCGLGFGATLERHYSAGIPLRYNDLYSKNLKQKLYEIRLYYSEKISQRLQISFSEFDHDAEDLRFQEYVERLQCLGKSNTVTASDAAILNDPSYNQCIVFEGAQGILLDKTYGFSPYITQSNTTSKNALEAIDTWMPSSTNVEAVYVTRCYLTRHGAGPMSDGKHQMRVVSTDETNVRNEFQREFRIAPLNINLLKYALKCDSIHANNRIHKRHLVITCLDHMPDNRLICQENNELVHLLPSTLAEMLGFDSYFLSNSPDFNLLQMERMR